MHQTRKGQQWYFGMKLQIGVDSRTKLIHSLMTTAANVHDGKMLGDLLHGDETRVSFEYHSRSAQDTDARCNRRSRRWQRCLLAEPR